MALTVSPPVSQWLHESLVEYVQDAAREWEFESAAVAWKLLTRLVDAGPDLDADLRHDLTVWLRVQAEWGVSRGRPVVAGDAHTLLVLLGAS